MIDYRDPPEELLVAGVSQIAFVVVMLAFIKLDLAPATPEFVGAAWVVAGIWATVAYFIASDWLANQQQDDGRPETLVSDERGVAAVTPVPVVAVSTTVIGLFLGGTVAGKMGLDPIVGVGYALVVFAMLCLFVAVPLRGGQSDG